VKPISRSSHGDGHRLAHFTFVGGLDRQRLGGSLFGPAPKSDSW
jgi:hypothetical protein